MGAGTLAGLAASRGTVSSPVEGSWRQGRGDAANTGVASGAGPAGPASARWRFRKHLVAGKPPVVHDGRLYVGYHDDRTAFVALDAATGDRRWRTTFEDPVGFPDAAAAVGDGVVVAPLGDLLVGLDPSSGAERWRRRPGDQLGAPVLTDGTAYLNVGEPGTVVAFNSVSGEQTWARGIGGWAPHGVAVADGRVYAVADREDGGDIVALDAASGAERWRRPLEYEPTSRPAVGDNGIFVGTEGGLAAFARDGTSRWTFPYTTREETPVDSYWSGSAPALADRTVYLGAPDGRVYAIDAETGDERWAFWTWNAVSGDPVVAGDTVYVASDDTFVYALDAADGTRRWEFDTAGDPDGAGAAVVNDMLFVAAREDGLYALEGP